jgi:hypothetical protein
MLFFVDCNLNFAYFLPLGNREIMEIVSAQKFCFISRSYSDDVQNVRLFCAGKVTATKTALLALTTRAL